MAESRLTEPHSYPLSKDSGLYPAIVAVVAFLILLSPELIDHYYTDPYSEDLVPWLREFGTYVGTIGMLIAALFARRERSLSTFALLGITSVLLLTVLQLSAHGLYGRYSQEDLTFTLQTLLCFVALWFVPSLLRTGRGVRLFPMFLVAVVIAMSLYSLVTEWDSYLGLAGVRDAYEIDIRSVFYNRNGFAQLIYMGFIAIFFLRPEKRGVDLLLLAIFGFVLTGTLSRAALLGVVSFLLIYSMMRYSMKPAFYRVLLALALLIVVVFFVRPSLFTYATRILIRGQVGDTGRSGIWIYGLQQMDTPGWLIGTGMHTAELSLQQSALGKAHYHSYYIGLIVAGGFLLCLAHLFLFLEFLRIYEKMLKSRPADATVYISAIFSFYLYAIFDNASFLIPGYEGIYISFLLLALPLSTVNERNPKLERRHYEPTPYA